jgi:sugar phosphate permease
LSADQAEDQAERTDAPKGLSRRWQILSAALLVQVTISMVTLGFPALVPFARFDLGLTRAEAGLFATVQNVGTMIALLPAGWAVDTLGERRVLVFGGIATGALAILAAFAPSFLFLLPVLILIGFAGATPTPAGSTAIISAFALRDRGLVMSIRQTGIPLGGALAALLLPVVAFAAGWRQALVVAGVFAILGALVCLRLMQQTVVGAVRGQIRSGIRSFREVAGHDATYVGIAGIFLTLGQFVLLSYIALYLIETWHMSVAMGSLFLVMANVGGVVGRMAWGTISDRLFGGVRKTPLMVVSLIASAGFVVLALLPPGTPLPLLIALVVLLGATVIGWNGIYVTLLSETADPEMRGRSVAYGMMLSQLGIFGGPPAFGLLVDLTRSYRLGWLAVSVLLLFSLVLVSQVRELRDGWTRTPTREAV